MLDTLLECIYNYTGYTNMNILFYKKVNIQNESVKRKERV